MTTFLGKGQRLDGWGEDNTHTAYLLWDNYDHLERLVPVYIQIMSALPRVFPHDHTGEPVGRVAAITP